MPGVPEGLSFVRSNNFSPGGWSWCIVHTSRGVVGAYKRHRHDGSPRRRVSRRRDNDTELRAGGPRNLLVLIQPKTRNDSRIQRLSAAGVLGWRVTARYAITACAATALVGLTVASAILAKEARSVQPLAAIETIEIGTESLDEAESVGSSAMESTLTAGESFVISQVSAPTPTPTPAPASAPAKSADGKKVYPAGTKFFDGRPVRVAKTIEMLVTAYSPDARSCAGSDDDLTATLHHVTTNGFKLVAADPRVLGYGSMLSIPGYDQGRIVPVLDCGGKIKGNRLDVLFPTHEEAVKWGVKRMKVTVYEYADGKPKTNPRKVR